MSLSVNEKVPKCLPQGDTAFLANQCGLERYHYPLHAVEKKKHCAAGVTVLLQYSVVYLVNGTQVVCVVRQWVSCGNYINLCGIRSFLLKRPKMDCLSHQIGGKTFFDLVRWKTFSLENIWNRKKILQLQSSVLIYSGGLLINP